MKKQYVVKRSGERVEMRPEKVMQKIEAFKYGLSPMIDAEALYADVCRGLYDGVETSTLDAFIAEQCAARATLHPDYSVLAGRIASNALVTAKTTPKRFSECVMRLGAAGVLSREFCDAVAEAQFQNSDLDALIVPERDYNFDLFGFRTLERSYLLRMPDGTIQETPQFMYLRVACALHLPNIEKVAKTYEILSTGLATQATPTLFNAGTPNAQMSSCFLLPMQEDSIAGIYDTIKQTALISKHAGGIGISASNIRAKNSYIRGTGGHSNGIVPMLRVLNDTARYVDQGGGKRKGSFAVYLETWHPDIFDFLELKKNHGKEEARARDLFYGLWISDLFMKRVEADAVWSLFCPNVCPELQDSVGDDFEAIYEAYEAQGKAIKQVPARELWNAILDAQIETGTPYMLYKDSCNKKSNQSHLGTIRSSNLCTEIIQYSSPTEVAVCNLASIALPKFYNPAMPHKVDIFALRMVVVALVENCNIIIDKNFYPVPEAQNSNMRHRPIGLGVQGLADFFAIAGIAFDSPEAAECNKFIFEAIYLFALDASCQLARRDGVYKTYKGSPASNGILQPDMWGVPTDGEDSYLKDMWAMTRKDIARYGLRNSLLVAPMPTASTSQILGNNECFEPFTSNIYVRRTISGEFVITNKHLVKDLEELGLWTERIRNAIIAADGSVQGIEAIPADIRARYKTAYEIKQKTILDMAAARGAYIDQSQSMNLFMRDPNRAKLTSMHFHAWKLGLKTGMYYLRSQAAAAPIKFTLEQTAKVEDKKVDAPKLCSLDNPDCEACGA